MSSPSFRSNESLGKLGEKALETWALQVGYTVNGSVDDRAGWDGYIESPPEAASLPRRGFEHQDTFPFRAWLQVKSTDKRVGYVNVALSNWLRLVEAPGPAFFLVIEFDGKPTPQSAYLVHVGEAEIRDVLKRRHENDVGPRRDLHKLIRRVRYDAAPRLHLLSGVGLIAAIDAVVDAVQGDYLAWKRSRLLGVGYEGGNAVAAVTFPGGDAHPVIRIAEIEVGLRPSIPFERLDLYPARFGLRVPDPELSVERGELIGPEPQPADRADLMIRVPALGIEARAEGDLFVPRSAVAAAQQSGDASVLTGMPIRVQAGRIRVTAPVDAAKLNLTFEPPESPDERVDLRGLREMASFMSAARRAADEGVPIEFVIRTRGGGCFESGPAPPGLSGLDGDDLLPFGDLVEATWRVCRSYDVAQDAEMSVLEIIDQADIIDALDNAERGTLTGEMSFQFTFDSEEAAEANDPEGMLAAYLCGLLVGDRRLLAVVQFGRAEVAEAEGLSRTVRVPADAPRVLYRHASRLGEPLPDFQMIGHLAAREAGEFVLVAQHPHLITGRPDATESKPEGDLVQRGRLR